jgi:hypothetical protein
MIRTPQKATNNHYAPCPQWEQGKLVCVTGRKES